MKKKALLTVLIILSYFDSISQTSVGVESKLIIPDEHNISMGVGIFLQQNLTRSLKLTFGFQKLFPYRCNFEGHISIKNNPGKYTSIKVPYKVVSQGIEFGIATYPLRMANRDRGRTFFPDEKSTSLPVRGVYTAIFFHLYPSSYSMDIPEYDKTKYVFSNSAPATSFVLYLGFQLQLGYQFRLKKQVMMDPYCGVAIYGDASDPHGDLSPSYYQFGLRLSYLFHNYE